jgi:hypothetical protein
MNTLVFECPVTHVDIVSGIHLDDRTCEVVESSSVVLPCVACGTTHMMRVKDGRYKAPDYPPLDAALRSVVKVLQSEPAGPRRQAPRNVAPLAHHI